MSTNNILMKKYLRGKLLKMWDNCINLIKT
jgi:hypothetical protein